MARKTVGEYTGSGHVDNNGCRIAERGGIGDVQFHIAYQIHIIGLVVAHIAGEDRCSGDIECGCSVIIRIVVGQCAAFCGGAGGEVVGERSARNGNTPARRSLDGSAPACFVVRNGTA